MRISAITTALLVATAATASPITFDDLDDFTTVTDQYAASNGVLFSGDLITSVDIGDFDFENPVTRDLRSWFDPGDGDADLFSAGLGFNLVNATIRFEAVENNYFEGVAFDLVRRGDQAIHITVEYVGGTTQEFSLPAPASGFGGLFYFETGLADGGLIRSVEIHNGGGLFGIDNITNGNGNTLQAVPLPGAGLLAGAGLLGVVTRRGRRGGTALNAARA